VRASPLVAGAMQGLGQRHVPRPIA
jgi:hypothetical protein